MATNQAAKLNTLKQAFITADKDGDSLLNKDEFKEFVEIGYQKSCPNGMYENLCSHFNRDPSIGIDWNTARAVWLQAQKSPTKSKSPAPPKQSNGITPQNNIKQAFIQCDKDADGFLNKQEFHEFVKVGFKKPAVPKGMYEQVCNHFKKDPSVGIDWLSVFALWKQSNPNASSSSASSPPTKKNKTPPPKKLNVKPPNLKRMQTESTVSSSSKSAVKTSKLGKMGQLSPTKSTGALLSKHQSRESLSGSGSSALTERNLRALEKSSGYGSKSIGDDEQSVDSDKSYRSQNRRHRRANSRDRGGGSFDDGPDASQMVVQMMESKVKNLQNQLKLERTKRKKTEELAQSLLTQNDEYKKQINDLQQSSTKSRTENKSFRDQLRKLKTIVDDDRQTIKHLQQQRNAMKSERDEAFSLLTKIEKEHAIMIKKEKNKHKVEMEKLSAGFLQSLGAEPGKDVTTVIKELKNKNIELQKNVDTLAETLARKQQSLLEALQAVDNIAMEDEHKQSEYRTFKQLQQSQQMEQNENNNNGQNGKMRERLKSLNQRRKSFGLNRMGSKDINNGNDDNHISGLPKPPKRRNSISNNDGNKKQKPHHRPTATFFKRAIGDNSGSKQKELNINNAKNGKELQFVSQQLTSEVSAKSKKIENLEVANTALIQELHKMQTTKTNDNDKNNDNNNHAKNESNASITDLP